MSASREAATPMGDRERGVIHAEWQAEKLSVRKRFLADKGLAEAAVEAAQAQVAPAKKAFDQAVAAVQAVQAQAELAKKAFDQAVAKVLAESAKVDALRKIYWDGTSPANKALLGSYPAVIDELIAYLQNLRRGHSSDRQQKIIAALGEAQALKINEDVSDFAAECARIKASIPGGN